MRKVAITGGLSCGKSTVCQLLKSYGAYVISADDIVHQLLSPDTKLGKQIINLLGQEIITETHQFDRHKIAGKVFQSPDLLSKLEKYLHPAVKAEIGRQYENIKDHYDYSLFVVEVPLLFEARFESFFDTIVVVTADAAVAKRRYVQSGGSEASYQSRMARQWKVERKSALGHWVIDNNGTLDMLAKRVEELCKSITE